MVAQVVAVVLMFPAQWVGQVAQADGLLVEVVADLPVIMVLLVGLAVLVLLALQ